MVSVQKHVTRIVKNREEITKAISYRLQFIDSARFMASSLSNLVDIHFGEIQKLRVQTVINSLLNTQTLNMNRI